MRLIAEHVTPNYAAHWKSIGRFLHIPEGKLEILEADYAKSVQRCNKMFHKWLDTDLDATWGKVLEAVENGCKSRGYKLNILYYLNTINYLGQFSIKFRNPRLMWTRLLTKLITEATR